MKSSTSLLPSLNRNSSTTQSKSHFIPKPTLHRIRYPPLSDHRAKENHQVIMLQSCISNKLYDDIYEQRRQQKITQELTPSEEGSKKCLEIVPNCIGKEAPIQYYNQYKSLNRTLLKRDLNNLTENNQVKIQSPTISLLQKAQSLKVLPLCLGLVKSKGQASILNISDYNLGDRYIMALSAGLKKARNIQKMFMSGNRITDLALADLASSISPEVTVLELAKNKITVVDKKLLQMIIEPQYRLEWLGLANNHLRESSADSVFRNVRYSKHLMRLDLRHNKLGGGCLESLIELLEKNVILQQLYIGGNYFSGRSGERVFKTLAHNKTLRVLDYSLNQLGDQSGLTVAQSISGCFQSNRSLQHLDLSFNNFSKEASQIISNGLQSNRTLYGLHFRGNYGYVNARGFLILAERQGTQLHSVDQFRIDGFNVTVPLLHNSLDSHNYRHACWICEGWYEQQFKLSLPKTSENMLVFIHFDFEKFEPRLISLSQHVKYTAMVPPRKYRFFYTVNNEILIDQNIPHQTLPFSQTHTYEMNSETRTFKVESVNFKTGKPKKIVNQWRTIIIKTLPRSNGLTVKKQKDPWTFDKSIWAKEWKLQNEQLLRKCFEKDWKCSKLPNLVKNQADQDKVKDILWNAYSSIKDLYKYFSSWNPFGDIWAVSSNPFTEFCQQSHIINKDTPLKIIDLTFITTNSMSSANYKGNSLVPERGLVRFQMMEVLVRLAQQKYKKLNLTDNFADAINQLLKEHVLPLAQNYNMQIWRTEKYFNEFNDSLIKKFRAVFSSIYKRNSKLKVRPGEKPFMCLAEFKSVFERIGLTTTLAQRDIFIAFNNSMMTQVDELENERFMRMTQIQFIEGVARCAQCLPSSCTLIQADNPPLHLKFQWIVQQLLNICPEDVRSQVPQMEESMFLDEQEE